MSHKRFDASRAHLLDDPERTTWLNPAAVISALNLKPGETVADIGAGTGYFTLPLADAVGVLGRVYAVDAQSSMLQHLRKKLEASPASIIELIHADAENTHLSSGNCDLVFIANVWHEFDDRRVVLQEARRILKNRGRIALLDWRPDVELVHGPPLAHRLSASSASDELLASGFERASKTNIGIYSWLVQAEESDVPRVPAD